MAPLIAFVIGVLALSGTWLNRNVPVESDNAQGQVHEDDPAWNWATMGNHKRGIVTLRGTPLVVGPHRYRVMMERRTRKERRIMGHGQSPVGDKWAMRHG